MKSYYGNALDPDNNKVVHDLESQECKITEELDDGISYDGSDDQNDYNFERYRDYKPEETQVCSNSISRPAIITLISILGVVVVSVIVIIIVNVSEGKSKASEHKDYNVSQDAGDNEEKKKDVTYARVEVKTEEDFEEDLAIEDEGNALEESTAEPTKKPDDGKIKEELLKLSLIYSSARTLADNMSDYPERLLEDVIRNPEMLDFALKYPEMVNGSYTESIDITRDVYNSNYDMPLFIQWDSRWGYYPYSSGVIGISGCGPTCLAMVYVHLTGDTSMNPLKMAKFSVNSGYVTVGVGTKWALMTTGANSFGLQAEKISISENNMIFHLQQGHPLIASMGPGVFTDNGHFIVFRKYENGKFYVNDPFCKKHTDTAWSYSEFSSQIKGMWAYWK